MGPLILGLRDERSWHSVDIDEVKGAIYNLDSIEGIGSVVYRANDQPFWIPDNLVA